MRRYWPEVETEDTDELHRNRQNLVAVFNQIVGQPSSEGLASQTAFINRTISYDEAVSYVRYAEYMVSTCNLKFAD